MTYEAIERKVIDIVRRAAEVSRSTSLEITEKDGSANIVTSADIATQNFLCDQLGELIAGSGFYCEEKDMKDTEEEYIWVIDPIDGTANYSRGIPDWVISVALLHNRHAVVGVVYNSMTDEMFSAHSGGGSRLNGAPIHVSSRPFGDTLLCTAMSLYKKELAKICNDIILEAYGKCNDVRRFGSCALELCYLAAGRCDTYFEIRVFPWDYAGAFVILREAGGVLRGFRGEEPSFDRPIPLVGANSEENYVILNETVNKYMHEVPYNE